jgi:Protein of unknown function (DUF419).
MISEVAFTEMALSFPGTEQRPHFDRQAYRVAGKRIFATYLPEDGTANIFLTPEEQSGFCSIDPVNIFPVSNKWGDNGATTFDLKGVSRDLVLEALFVAYNQVLEPRGKR